MNVKSMVYSIEKKKRIGRSKKPIYIYKHYIYNDERENNNLMLNFP